MALSPWRDCSCSAGAAQQTFIALSPTQRQWAAYSCCGLTPSDVPMSSIGHLLMGTWCRQWSCLNSSTCYSPSAQSVWIWCHPVWWISAWPVSILEDWRITRKVSLARPSSAHAPKCLHLKIMRTRWEEQLSFRIDLGGKHHRFIAKCLIDLCFAEIKRKKIQSIFSPRSESKPLPASTGLAALAKREHLEHLRVLSGLERMKGNVGKLSAGRSG